MTEQEIDTILVFLQPAMLRVDYCSESEDPAAACPGVTRGSLASDNPWPRWARHGQGSSKGLEKEPEPFRCLLPGPESLPPGKAGWGGRGLYDARHS